MTHFNYIMDNSPNKLLERDYMKMSQLLYMLIRTPNSDKEKRLVLEKMEQSVLYSKRISEQFRERFVYRRWDLYNQIPPLDLPPTLHQGVLDVYGYDDYRSSMHISFR